MFVKVQINAIFTDEFFGMIFKETLQKLRFLNAKQPQKAVEFIIEHWQNKANATVIHFMYYASLELIRKDTEYAKSMVLADFILVDGIGMQTYFKSLMKKEMSNLNGTDLSPLFFQQLSKNSIPISLYGTTKEQIEACYKNLLTQHSTNIITHFQDGFSALDWNKIPINSALFVGLGTPLQENWVRQNLDKIQEKKLLVITVGGYFDFLSGFYVRAPKWVRSIKMEWAWRTMLHPGRHYKKRLRDTTIFFRPFIDKYNKLPSNFNIVDID